VKEYLKIRERIQARVKLRMGNRVSQPLPRYDGVFEEGTRYLDEIAGRGSREHFDIHKNVEIITEP